MNETSNTLRDQAIKRLKQKRDFMAHVLTYVAVNAFIVGIWAFTSGGFFWPIFPMGGWGIGLLMHGWDVYFGGTTEEDIAKEMDRLAHGHR